MKKFGSICDYKDERLADLRKAVHHIIQNEEWNDSMEIYRKAVDRPARRFYVSSERAAIVVSLMMKGHHIGDRQLTSRREMYEEIYRRVVELKKIYPEKSLMQLCIHVVNSPAPKFYLTPQTARELMFRYKREKQRERRNNILRQNHSRQ